MEPRQPGASSSACSLPRCTDLVVVLSLCTGLRLAQQKAAAPGSRLSLNRKQAGARSPCTGQRVTWQSAAVQGSRRTGLAWEVAPPGYLCTKLAQQRVPGSQSTSSSGLGLTQRQVAPQTRPAHSLMCPPAACLAGRTRDGLNHHPVRCLWIRTPGTCCKCQVRVRVRDV